MGTWKEFYVQFLKKNHRKILEGIYNKIPRITQEMYRDNILGNIVNKSYLIFPEEIYYQIQAIFFWCIFYVILKCTLQYQLQFFFFRELVNNKTNFVFTYFSRILPKLFWYYLNSRLFSIRKCSKTWPKICCGIFILLEAFPYILSVIAVVTALELLSKNYLKDLIQMVVTRIYDKLLEIFDKSLRFLCKSLTCFIYMFFLF